MAYSKLTVQYNGLTDPHEFIPGNLDLHSRDYGVESDGFTAKSYLTSLPTAYLGKRKTQCGELICGSQCTFPTP